MDCKAETVFFPAASRAWSCFLSSATLASVHEGHMLLYMLFAVLHLSFSCALLT